MISRLRGTVIREHPGQLTVDVGGVGYCVHTPIDVWEALPEGDEALLHITTYVREDRFDLFGFTDARTRTLFEHLIEIAGIGPRTGLELCGVPRSLLAQAVVEEDASCLTSVKGIGKKTAEKLLLELKSLAEKDPDLFAGSDGAAPTGMRRDPDAIAALAQLGYKTADILRTLDALPGSLHSTEERVAAALQHL